MALGMTAREWLEFWDTVLACANCPEAVAELDRLHMERA
jgi:hypothetical protein